MDPLFQGIQNVMAKQNGAESTRYCGGCHDPISLFSGTKNIFVENLTNLHGYQEGVSCLSCHVNGHTTGQFHLVPDVQPHMDRPRIETVTLRGVFAMRTFGSKRNLRSIEDFTEVENNTAYFDGDLVAAERKGARHFTRRELAAMAATRIFDFIDLPP